MAEKRTLVERFCRQTTKFCDHGLSDDVDIQGVNVIDGRVARIKRYNYYCREHELYGSFALTEKKQLAP